MDFVHAALSDLNKMVYQFYHFPSPKKIEQDFPDKIKMNLIIFTN